jgi:hypothetical protein
MKFHQRKKTLLHGDWDGCPHVHVMFSISKWRFKKKGGKNVARVEVLKKKNQS